MCWYAAHIIEYLKFLDGEQDSYEVYENIVLIEADNNDAALIEAKKLGQKYEVEVTVGPENRPARWIFAGIRTLVECQNVEADALEQPLNYKPLHGTEVTYIPMRVDSEEALARLVNGQSVSVTLDDITPLTDDDIADILKPFAGKGQK